MLGLGAFSILATSFGIRLTGAKLEVPMTTDTNPYRLTVDGFAADHFRVLSLTGKETISEAWWFDVVVSADAGGDPVERMALAQRATLIFELGEKQRAFYGIVAAVHLSGVHVADHALRYVVRVVPRLWLLRRKKRSRIFQKMRVPDIVSSVLREAGIATRWQLARAYPEREYCTQYEETDYRFVQRILAEVGIFFYFFGGGPVDSAALGADAAVGAAAAVGSSVAAFMGAPAVGALAGAAAQMAETLIPGDTVVCADDAACYPPVAGDDPAALAASTAAAMAPAVGDLVGAGDGIAGAALGAASAVAGRVIAGVVEGRHAGPVFHFMNDRIAAVDVYDKVTRFSLRNTVRSSAAMFRTYDPDRPQVRLKSVAASTQPFPPSPFDVVADAASTAENVAGATASVLPGQAAGVLGAVGDAVSTVDAAVNEVAGALGQRVPFEVYEHHDPFLFPKWSFGSEEAPRILRQKRRRASIAKGEGGCFDFSPAHRFTLENHPAAQLDGAYVLTSVEHRGQSFPVEGEPFRVYAAIFECAPAEMPYPPPRPKRKSIQVALTATVVGPAGEEIHVDEKGQIKVQFHWDREGRYDERSSCWIRTMQPWGGASWGHQFIPRVGMEVVVVFEGGDPDKPMVLGSLYNGTHPMPFSLPGDKTRSGWRTQSSPGGGGFNELSFEDAAGREQIYMHAQRNLDEVVEKNHTRLVRSDEFIRVLGSRMDRIEKNLAELVNGDRTSQVNGNRIDVVTGNSDERVSGTLVTRVEGKERRDVTENADLSYAADITTRVLGCMTTIVGKADAKRSWQTHAQGTAKLSSLDATEISSEKELTLRVGKSSIRITSDNIEIQSAAVTAKGRGGGLSADDDGLMLSSKADAQILVEKKIVLQSKDGSSLAMQKEVKVDGSQILLNSPEQAKDPPPKAPDPPTTVALTDQEGTPVPYQRFVVTLADKSQVSAMTDEDGKAELTIPSSGKIVFPDLTMPNEPREGDPQPYVVKQGDHIDRLALVHGFDADAVWNDGKNAELKAKRRKPNVLFAGDVLYFPRAKKTGQPVSKGTTNSYTVSIPKKKVSLTFKDERVQNASYTVRGLGALVAGSTSGGAFSVDVPVHVREFVIGFDDIPLVYNVRLGDLDPISETSGVRQRLEHLGFRRSTRGAAETEEEAAAADSEAITAFQTSQDLGATGVADDATRAALESAHGS